VSLNVGGTRFTTSRDTLESCQRLKNLVSGPPGPDGSYFLDRDGRFFSEVLNFLRDGPEFFIAPTETDARRLLQREAVFFGLPELAEIVKVAYCGAALPFNEAERLQRLEGLDIMHTNDGEHHYEAITRMIAAILDVPIALISLVGEDHQWFKARTGLDATQTSRNTSFCAFTFTPEDPSSSTMFVIENAKADPRVVNNPLVTGPPHIIFYAGSPIVTSDGIRLGALCAIDRVPRSISPFQAQVLVNFSQLTALEIQRWQLMGNDERLPYYESEACLHRQESAPMPGHSDWAAGPMREARMREALKEAIVLVAVRTDSTDWPILYANQVWSDMSGILIVPPERFPGRAEVKALHNNVTIKPGRRDYHFLDWLQLVDKNERQLCVELQHAWQQPEPQAFALKGRVTPFNSAGKAKAAMITRCRFSPADLPIDAAAEIIQPVPQRAPGTWHTGIPGVHGRLYFATMVNCLQTADQQSRVSDSSLISTFSTSTGGDRPKRGNTVEAVAALKPPKPPFDDVRLLRMVGAGSFGKVYYGLWMGSPVAVKIIESENKEKHKRFEPAFEAVLSASMAHPNLVQTFMSSSRQKPKADSVGEDDQQTETWLVQEWCDRGTLGAYCNVPRIDGAGLVEVLEISMDIAGAGSYLHTRGIIHGDLTANNVLIKTMVTRKGYVCKICDFGLARVLEEDSTDIMTTQLGTVTHMPPELFAVAGGVRLTAMADIYAAGILLWQALQGESPFRGLTPPQVVVRISQGKRLVLPQEVPQGLRRVFEACTSRDPVDRPTFDALFKIYGGLLTDVSNAATSSNNGAA